MPEQDPQAELKAFAPKHKFFVGIDSDGCAFDTMELKHKECFIPNIINHWELQAVSKYARMAAEFVNLYSQVARHQPLPGADRWSSTCWRTGPRWPARGAAIPRGQAAARVDRDGKGPRQPRAREGRQGDRRPRPRADASRGPRPSTSPSKRWSTACRRSPSSARASRSSLAFADIIVRLRHARRSPRARVGRARHREVRRRHRRPGDGLQERAPDASPPRASTRRRTSSWSATPPGDLKAARSIGALFFPVNPGREDESWEFFHKEALDVFKAGKYAGDYEKRLIEKFEKLLPSTPPWKK